MDTVTWTVCELSGYFPLWKPWDKKDRDKQSVKKMCKVSCMSIKCCSSQVMALENCEWNVCRICVSIVKSLHGVNSEMTEMFLFQSI